MQTAYNNFDSKERSLITARAIDELWDGQGGFDTTATLSDQALWPLSLAECDTLSTNLGIGDAFSDDFWLRSPYLGTFAYVGCPGGGAAYSGRVHGPLHAVRPAFKLNLSSVLFTSAATGGKSVTVGDDLSAAAPPTGPVKLTLLDSATTLLVSNIVQTGNAFSFDYTATGTNYNTLSAIVRGADGVVKYYGQLDTSPAASGVSGNSTVNLPTGFAAGDKLEVFVEQINGANLTDYASTPQTLYALASTQSTDSDYTPTFTTRTLTDPLTGVRLNGNNIDPNARLRVTANWLHAQDTCPACDEIRAQMAAGNVLALYDISLTGYHTGAYDLFIPFTGNTGQSYTTLHCLKGTLEQRTAPYNNGGTTTTWAKLSPFAVVKDVSVTVPDTVVVDPPKTGDAAGYGMAGIGLIVCALLGLGAVRRRKGSEKG